MTGWSGLARHGRPGQPRRRADSGGLDRAARAPPPRTPSEQHYSDPLPGGRALRGCVPRGAGFRAQARSRAPAQAMISREVSCRRRRRRVRVTPSQRRLGQQIEDKMDRHRGLWPGSVGIKPSRAPGACAEAPCRARTSRRRQGGRSFAAGCRHPHSPSQGAHEAQRSFSLPHRKAARRKFRGARRAGCSSGCRKARS